MKLLISAILVISLNWPTVNNDSCRMKIGFVLDDTLDTTDGVQQYVLTMGAWLSRQGHDVHYLVGQTTRKDISGIHSLSRNMAVRFNGNRMSMPLPADKHAIQELLSVEQFDVLHIQVPYSPWLAHRIILSVPPRTVVIGTFHIAPHSSLVRQANHALAFWTKRSLKRFDGIVSVSSAAAHFAHQAYGIETAILPNVIEVAHFARSKPFARYRDRPMIMFLGRLVERKGCQLLLEALVNLKHMYPQLTYRLVICGRGPLEGRLKNYVADHGLQEMVEFTGFVSETDKPRYLRSADLAVFPSSGGESFGIVLLEAMSANHPVVLAADNPGYGAVMAPYPDSLFPVKDANSLADKLYVFLTDADERRRACKWQTSYVPSFDVAVVGAQLSQFYQSAIQKRAGSEHDSVR